MLFRSLGSQSFGANPDDLLQQVVPTIDLVPFFSVNQTKQERNTGGRTTPGLITNVNVADDEQWLLLAASLYMEAGATGAGGDVLGHISVRNIAGNSPVSQIVLTQDKQRHTLAAGERYSLSWNAKRPFILPQGARVDALYDICSLANADTVALNVLYVALAE